MAERTLILEPVPPKDTHGPAYPKLGATVEKLRRAPRTAENDRKLGAAILDAFYRLNRPVGLATADVIPKARTGKQILASIVAGHRAALDRALADDHRNRTDHQVGLAYKAAMKGDTIGLVSQFPEKPTGEPLMRCNPYLSEAQMLLAIDALRSSKGDRGASSPEISLANYLEADLKATRDHVAAQEAERAAEAARRAVRAEGHVLTSRQAVCLAAVRADKSPYWVCWSWTDPATGAVKWNWRHGRSMGGAMSRMVDKLIEEGLLSDRRELTEGGCRRLEGYEQKHGHVGP